MKLINILFSIYIILLSCMPCADAEINIGNKTASIHTETKSDSSQHHDDACSPFCTCNCCNSSSFYKVTQYFENTIISSPITSENKTEYTSSLFSNFHNSIWQPPQIS